MASTEPLVAVITGAGSGIGRATARLLASRGARLVLADINADAVATVAKECEPEAASVLAIEFDQRSTRSVDEMVARAVEECGRIDFMANIAGVFPIAPILSTSDEMFDDVVATNLRGTFACCRAVGPVMLAQGSGSIVNIASGAAVLATAGLGAYGATKAGIVGLSRVLALELAPTVRVNVVAPGPTRTEGAGARAAGGGPDVVITGIPLERWGEPIDIANMIAFLSTPESAYVTGQVIHVNGGRFMP